jgi:hypothetical protein
LDQNLGRSSSHSSSDNVEGLASLPRVSSKWHEAKQYRSLSANLKHQTLPPEPLVSDLCISIHFYSFLIFLWPFSGNQARHKWVFWDLVQCDAGSSTCSSGCSSRERQRHCLFQSAAWFKECVRVGPNWGSHEPTDVVIFSTKPSRFGNSIDPYSSASVCERGETTNSERLDQTWPSIVIVQVISSQPYPSWSGHPCRFLQALNIAAGTAHPTTGSLWK